MRALHIVKRSQVIAHQKMPPRTCHKNEKRPAMLPWIPAIDKLVHLPPKPGDGVQNLKPIDAGIHSRRKMAYCMVFS